MEIFITPELTPLWETNLPMKTLILLACSARTARWVL
jgi:hypothetical protein